MCASQCCLPTVLVRSLQLTVALPGTNCVQDTGVFVSFYAGLSGLAPLAELGLGPGATPQSTFTVGQVRLTVLTSWYGMHAVAALPRSVLA